MRVKQTHTGLLTGYKKILSRTRTNLPLWNRTSDSIIIITQLVKCDDQQTAVSDSSTQAWKPVHHHTLPPLFRWPLWTCNNKWFTRPFFSLASCFSHYMLCYVSFKRENETLTKLDNMLFLTRFWCAWCHVNPVGLPVITIRLHCLPNIFNIVT